MCRKPVYGTSIEPLGLDASFWYMLHLGFTLHSTRVTRIKHARKFPPNHFNGSWQFVILSEPLCLTIVAHVWKELVRHICLFYDEPAKPRTGQT